MNLMDFYFEREVAIIFKINSPQNVKRWRLMNDVATHKLVDKHLYPRLVIDRIYGESNPLKHRYYQIQMRNLELDDYVIRSHLNEYTSLTPERIYQISSLRIVNYAIKAFKMPKLFSVKPIYMFNIEDIKAYEELRLRRHKEIAETAALNRVKREERDRQYRLWLEQNKEKHQARRAKKIRRALEAKWRREDQALANNE